MADAAEAGATGAVAKTPEAVRLAARAGELRASTSGLAPGFAQANLAVVPRALAADFAAYCAANPRPCPVVEALPPGGFEPACAPGADLRTDLPGYRVYRRGELVAEPDDVRGLWGDDVAAFLLGCSFTFEAALLRRGFRLAHAGSGRSVAMYRTSRPTSSVGPFRGPLVVSMRWIPAARVDEAVEVTGRFPHHHGAPVHIGDPAALGIADLARPDYGAAWPGGAGEVPVFWACGVTPQAAAIEAGIELMITHAPGRMFVTDLAAEA